MNDRKKYRVTAERDGDWWVISFPQLRGASQARRLDRVEAVARDYIYGLTDEPPDAFDVEVVPLLGERLDGMIDEALGAREVANEAQRRASDITRSTASELQRLGLSMRDIGILLGVTHQRAQQLLAGREGRVA